LGFVLEIVPGLEIGIETVADYATAGFEDEKEYSELSLDENSLTRIDFTR
jgi:hypothetical protein